MAATDAHRLSRVIEWDPETEGGLPLLIVDGRTFTWDQIGHMMMTFEGFTLNAIVEDTIEVVGGPLARFWPIESLMASATLTPRGIARS